MRQAALLVALACLLAVPVAGAATAPSAQSAALQQQSQTAANVDITVQIQADGAARWTVSSKYPLEDENAVESFERLRSRFEADETDSEFSVDVFRAVVPSVSDRVGREMEIRGVTRSSRVVEAGNTTGVLTIQFTWTNFSRVEDDRVVVDSFSGGWFGDLAADQTLTLLPPPGYDTENVLPETSIVDNGYRWSGPYEFDADRPFAVFTAADTVVGVSMTVLVGVGVVALFAGAGTVWAYYRDEPFAWLRDVIRTVVARVAGAESAESVSATEEPADEAATAGGATAGAAGASERAEEPVDPELLSDEERVERLLREHGGRMKQSAIVEETRWSTAKVSQLLSSMAEEGRVEKLRIGRENLISLPGEGLDEGLDEE